MHAQTNGKVSDGSQVPKTGYELIRSRKRKGKLATMADYAKIDFQPWKDEGKKPGETYPPTRRNLGGLWRVRTHCSALRFD